MKVYTGYFGILSKLPANIVPISICGKAPDWYTGIQYKKLAPTYSIFSEYKSTYDADRYSSRFVVEVLAKLNPVKVFRELVDLSGGKDICLICYEKPSDFCHRQLVAKWLGDVEEYHI